MATSYLTQTLGAGPTLGTKCTVSYWCKRSGLTAWDNSGVFGGYSNASGTNNDNFQIGWNSSDQFYCWGQSGTSTEYNLESTPVARDVSGWYHVCWILDSTESSSSDRIKLYINGTQVTSWAASSYPSSSFAFPITKDGNIRTVGRFTNTGGTQMYFNGSLSNIAVVDGSALAATTFGQVDSTSGIWKYKSPSGVTWGTNGFWLKGENSGNLGLDSGASNNFSSGGGTPTQSIDTPSNVYTNFSQLIYNDTIAYTQANHTVDGGDANYRAAITTLGASTGKWYAEFKAVSGFHSADKNCGIYRLDNVYVATTGLGNYTSGTTWSYGSNGLVRSNNTTQDTEATFADGDVIGVAMDLTNNKLYFAKNGSWINGGDPTSGSTGTGAYAIVNDGEDYAFAATVINSGGKNVWSLNAGTGYFGTTAISSAGTSSSGDDSVWEHDCPTGYYGLSTKNINTYG